MIGDDENSIQCDAWSSADLWDFAPLPRVRWLAGPAGWLRCGLLAQQAPPLRARLTAAAWYSSVPRCCLRRCWPPAVRPSPCPSPPAAQARRATAAGSQRRHSRCLHPPAGRDPLSCCPRHCCCRELPPARPQMLAGCSTKRSTPSPASASTSTASLGASLLSSTSIPPIRTGALSSNGWRGRVRPAAILAGAGYAAERR